MKLYTVTLRHNQVVDITAAGDYVRVMQASHPVALEDREGAMRLVAHQGQAFRVPAFTGLRLTFDLPYAAQYDPTLRTEPAPAEGGGELELVELISADPPSGALDDAGRWWRNAPGSAWEYTADHGESWQLWGYSPPRPPDQEGLALTNQLSLVGTVPMVNAKPAAGEGPTAVHVATFDQADPDPEAVEWHRVESLNDMRFADVTWFPGAGRVAIHGNEAGGLAVYTIDGLFNDAGERYQIPGAEVSVLDRPSWRVSEAGGRLYACRDNIAWELLPGGQLAQAFAAPEGARVEGVIDAGAGLVAVWGTAAGELMPGFPLWDYYAQPLAGGDPWPLPGLGSGMPRQVDGGAVLASWVDYGDLSEGFNFENMTAGTRIMSPDLSAWVDLPEGQSVSVSSKRPHGHTWASAEGGLYRIRATWAGGAGGGGGGVDGETFRAVLLVGRGEFWDERITGRVSAIIDNDAGNPVPVTVQDLPAVTVEELPPVEVASLPPVTVASLPRVRPDAPAALSSGAADAGEDAAELVEASAGRRSLTVANRGEVPVYLGAAGLEPDTAAYVLEPGERVTLTAAEGAAGAWYVVADESAAGPVPVAWLAVHE